VGFAGVDAGNDAGARWNDAAGAGGRGMIGGGALALDAAAVTRGGGDETGAVRTDGVGALDAVVAGAASWRRIISSFALSAAERTGAITA